MLDRDRRLAWHGVALLLLGLLTGLVQQALRNPRMGLSAHLEGVMNGIFLLALAAAWPKLRLSDRLSTLAYRSVLVGTYGNWGVTMLAAVLGTAAMTPIASAGFGAPQWQEALVTFGFVFVGLAILAASAVLLVGFGSRALRPGSSATDHRVAARVVQTDNSGDTKVRALEIPEKFNRNSPTVTSLMSPEQSGLWLLQRLQRLLGLSNFTGTALLDYGCGVRFTQTFVNLGLPVGRYAGVDCFEEMIDFLATTVEAPNFSYHFIDVWHPSYNPSGATRLGTDTVLPLPEGSFDVATMFSVITHQTPEDTGHIFSMLRRYVRKDGHLFFTCFLDPTIDGYEDRSPERTGGRCVYNPEFLAGIILRSGWVPVGSYPAEAPLIGDSFLCRMA
jgi:hydroxylaminobenzene mutase